MLLTFKTVHFHASLDGNEISAWNYALVAKSASASKNTRSDPTSFLSDLMSDKAYRCIKVFYLKKRIFEKLWYVQLSFM